MKSHILLSLLSFAPQLSVQLPSANGVAIVNHPRASPLIDEPLALAERQQQQEKQEKNDTCDKCTNRKCSGGRFRDQNTCRCANCPKGQKANPAGDGCIPDGNNNKNNEERKKKKQDLTQKTVERKKKAFKKKSRADKKKKLIENTRKRKKTEFQRNRKRTRMGKCLLLVPLAMFGVYEGTTAVSTYAEDFFSEDFVTGDAIDEFWPGDFLDPLDVNIDSDEYLQAYVELAAKKEDDKDTRWKDPIVPIGVKREESATITAPNDMAIPEKFKRVPIPHPSTTDMTVGTHHLDKRNPLAAILRAILAFTGRLGSVTTTTVSRFASIGQRVSARLKDLSARGGARLAKGGGKAGVNKMKDAARAISKNKNWKNCLNGAKPV
ncbi:uncharacterized protein JN550_003729 [Neoarthrinium moseri]|uniref:uncharacterized protein n=1 Tax=Neoarthrinium moseri TaxID=1658444 RepID=UPI001FDDC5B5|nr:uncharacterized protein JN550_003729 [Neoarthrinium moseri]KAI1872855.1 hypothetical protein JN550_003729 [Neoarthrinium moseri]